MESLGHRIFGSFVMTWAAVLGGRIYVYLIQRNITKLHRFEAFDFLAKMIMPFTILIQFLRSNV